MKKLSHFLQYAKFYMEPDSKKLAAEAYKSAKDYYAGKFKTPVEFQSYQHGYKSGYRRVYAQIKMAQLAPISN
jgi:hypothetical protein